MEERKWHNIRPNELTRIPRRHVFIDTEARRERRGKLETQHWRCGVAIYADRKRNGDYKTDSRDYLNLEDMWRDVSNFASREGRSIVWCHNLAYDIRIAELFTVLPSLGWKLTSHNTASRGTWLEWRRNEGSLILVDSFSVYTTSIERIGQWFGVAKPELPSDDADLGTWLDRCRADCRILSTAVLHYLKWIKVEDLGNWQLTGNGQAWAAFRHRFMTHKLTVHSEQAVLEVERRAMWAGRCEAYWHGELPDQRIYEYDFVRAYPTIARDYAVPVKYVGVVDNPDAVMRILEKGTHGVIADISIQTDVPVLPTEHQGRILWPTGKFRSTVWDVEIQAAINSGASVHIRRAWIYRKAPALRAWGTWVIDRLDSPDDCVPAWQKSVLKHWSRSLIGRMAMTYSRWEYDGEMPDERVEAGWVKDDRTGEISEYMQVGNGLWLNEGKTEWQHSMPMITGYVQAVARVQLWEVLRRMPFRSVLYCDTDSVFVTQEFVSDIEAVIAEIPGCGMRLKRVWDGVAIYGPRQIVTGQEVRISGIPKRAERTGRREFEGEIWESLGTAIQFGQTNTVRIRDRKWTVAGVDHRRKSTGFGFTEPFELMVEE